MRYVVGIDEVGRGSLAGPVTVAAVAMPKNLVLRTENLGKLRDSKKLSKKRREEWFRHFASHPKISYAIARVYPRRIEKMNITKAANLAALRAFHKLTTRYLLLPTRFNVFLDGGLCLGNHRGPSRTVRGTTRKIQRESAPSPRLSATTLVRGDEKIRAIKIASIIAKVHRDRFMVRLAKEYPQYGFEAHKGYGTKNHLRAIRKHGPSEVHRLTFIPKSYRI